MPSRRTSILLAAVGLGLFSTSLWFLLDIGLTARTRGSRFFSQHHDAAADIGLDCSHRDPAAGAQPRPDELEGVPQRRSVVAVASTFGFHFDVYMTVVKTLGDVLINGTISVYAPEFRFGFDDVVEEMALWTQRGVRAPAGELIGAINANTGDGGIDLVVLGTCEVDLNNWQDELADAWDKRDAAHKFKVVCGVHNVKDTRWQQHITYWARRDAIRILAIGDHVADSFKHKFEELADSPEPEIYSAGYQYIPVDVHVPIIDVPDLPMKAAPRHLSKAVIQGTINAQRRDYARVFDDLIASLKDDPAAWGYLPLQGNQSYLPDRNAPVPPFELLLVGMGSIDIPQPLAHIVSIHQDLSYKDFYALVANTDIVVPAFASFGYFEDQASSTVALATELAVPLLVTTRHRATYRYIDDARAVVTRPAAMPEVAALRALRTGSAAAFLGADPAGTGMSMGERREVREAVERMMREGWGRGRAAWAAWREGVWERNRRVVRKMLRDLA